MLDRSTGDSDGHRSDARAPGCVEMGEGSRWVPQPPGEPPMLEPVTDPVDTILSALERDVERAVTRAVSRLTRLPAADRRRADPYLLLLRRSTEAAPRRD